MCLHLAITRHRMQHQIKALSLYSLDIIGINVLISGTSVSGHAKFGIQNMLSFIKFRLSISPSDTKTNLPPGKSQRLKTPPPTSQHLGPSPAPAPLADTTAPLTPRPPPHPRSAPPASSSVPVPASAPGLASVSDPRQRSPSFLSGLHSLAGMDAAMAACHLCRDLPSSPAKPHPRGTLSTAPRMSAPPRTRTSLTFRHGPHCSA